MDPTDHQADMLGYEIHTKREDVEFATPSDGLVGSSALFCPPRGGQIVADRDFRMLSALISRTSATVLRPSATAISSYARVALRSHLVLGFVPTHGASVGRCGAISSPTTISAGLP